jgi:hypothetical protein
MPTETQPERRQVTFWLDGDLLKRVDALATSEDRSRARQLNVLIRKALGEMESEQRSPRKRRAA